MFVRETGVDPWQVIDDVLSIQVIPREICEGSRNTFRRTPEIIVDHELGQAIDVPATCVSLAGSIAIWPFVALPEKRTGMPDCETGPILFPA